jgi:cell division protein FtsN
MAQRRKRRSSRTKRSSRSRQKHEYPGWAWGIWGLAIGLSVAAAVWVSDRRAQPVPSQVATQESTFDDNGENAVPGEAQTESKTKRFEFYDILPLFEVIIPEEDPEVAADVGPKAVEVPGTYILQAGSFTAFVDADRRRAQLALQGIKSAIQRVTIDDKTYHRVRIGPIDDLDELNMLRSRLRAAKIDVLIIRLRA